jgi:hypothetical protein
MKFDDLLPAINPIIQRSARECKKKDTKVANKQESNPLQHHFSSSTHT